MKIWIAQINTRVWNLDYNKKKIIQSINELKNADIIVFPESTIWGYPMNDLLEFNDFVIQQKEIVKEIQSKITNDLKVVLGFVDYDKNSNHPNWHFTRYNASAVIAKNGMQIYHKHLLPNYDVFHEKRWFSPGGYQDDSMISKWYSEDFKTISQDDTFIKTDVLVDKIWKERFGITICEDIWDEFYFEVRRDLRGQKRKNFIHNIENLNLVPLQKYLPYSLDFMINLSSSPFEIGKIQKRYRLIKKHIQQQKSNFVYVNQVWAQDEIIFDGWSMIFNKNGDLIYFSKFFEEDLQVIDTEKLKKDKSKQLFETIQDKYSQIEKALVLWLKDYFDKNGLKKAVIWISGGIDSAVSLYLLSKFLKPENIKAVYLPSKFSSELSLKLAKQLCKNLNIPLEIKNIQKIVDTMSEWENVEWITYENLQARVRWNILMMKANQIWWIVINNTNETELILWYGTAYGDLIWAISPLGNLNKKEIYEFAKWINKIYNNIIPNEIITRPASAELSENQTDPFDYEKISDLVYDYFFWKISFENLKKIVWTPEAEKITKLIKISEWKRKQAPLVLKLKERSIGNGRIMPITR